MATKYAGQNALNKLMQLVKTALSGKLDKSGGTITGNLKVNGDLEPVNGLTTSGGVYAQTVSTPVLALHDNGTAGANASINVSGAGAVEVTVPDGDKRAKARVKVGTPTDDDDAVTKKYADAALDKKLNKTGGTVGGNLVVDGSLRTGTFSATNLGIYTSDLSHGVTLTCDDGSSASLAGEAEGTYARLSVGAPTDGNDATTKTYVDNKVSGLQTAAQVKAAINSALTGVYTPRGSISFANLPQPQEGNKGYVYNVLDGFTTTSSFLEGAGHSYGAGTNIVCVVAGSGSYKWDVLAGTIDLTEMTATEVQTLWDSI